MNTFTKIYIIVAGKLVGDTALIRRGKTLLLLHPPILVACQIILFLIILFLIIPFLIAY
jgi:hypothetical protein